MANPVFIHGRLGLISINSTNFFAEQFDFTETVVGGNQDITYCVAGGATYQVMLAGYNGVKGTITFIYDTANQPVLSPFSMIPGTLMALILYPDGTKPYTFSALSGEFKWGSGPKAGPVRCTTSYDSTGNVTHPSS